MQMSIVLCDFARLGCTYVYVLCTMYIQYIYSYTHTMRIVLCALAQRRCTYVYVLCTMYIQHIYSYTHANEHRLVGFCSTQMYICLCTYLYVPCIQDADTNVCMYVIYTSKELAHAHSCITTHIYICQYCRIRILRLLCSKIKEN
jgi:hypothetical protein